ncbi:hypothetical protein PJP10_32865, partial [Mycobacterium kansasii]
IFFFSSSSPCFSLGDYQRPFLLQSGWRLSGFLSGELYLSLLLSFFDFRVALIANTMSTSLSLREEASGDDSMASSRL